MSQELATRTDRIESRIDKAVSASTGLTTTGAMAFSSVEQIMEFAKVMAIGGIAIPKHLRENVGACLAVAIQASEWQMSPFAVASKTYVVNDRIAFEAQLVNAVILRRAPITGRFKISYAGEGQSRKCRVAVKLNDGDEVEYESPTFGAIPVKNSPLWKSDPDQQLFYYSSRAMCRRHFPDVLLGIYTPDEVQDFMDVPSEVRQIPEGKIGVVTTGRSPLEDTAPQKHKEQNPHDAEVGGHPAPEAKKEAAPTPPAGPTADELRKELIGLAKASNIGRLLLSDTLAERGLQLATLEAAALADLIAGWDELRDSILNPK